VRSRGAGDAGVSMPGLWQKTMVYLGLKEDDELPELDLDEEFGAAVHEPHPAEAPAMRRRVGAATPEAVPEGSSGLSVVGGGARVRPVPVGRPAGEPGDAPVIRPLPVSASPRVHVIEPAGFNDAQEIGDRFRNDQPVILNLQGCGKDLRRRLIDFASGLTYALGGTMSRVADHVFLLTPSNVEVSQEEKERLQARGLFRA